jgi:predicted unusual protein kinase regulating ubiquinone biosynthesis (AarF/ABC1/UbiB family)
MGSTYVGHRVRDAVGAKTDVLAVQERVAQQFLSGMIQLRGTALKVAQMLSMSEEGLPDGMKKVLSQAQHSVPPMSAPLVRKVFSTSIGKSPEDVFDKFSSTALRAASLGQVHEAWLDGKRLAVKIQYPGVADSVKSDIQMVRSLARTAISAMPRSVADFNPDAIDPYLKEIEARLMEETDYRIELANSQAFAALCANQPGVVFPQYYPELSSSRVITMEWLDGVHLQEFLAAKPDEELRGKVAQNLWDYYEFQLHTLHRLNTDTHPGNFLLRPDGSIGLLDFGNTKTVSEELYQDFSALTKPDFFKDKDAVRAVFIRLDILRESDTKEIADMIFGIFEQMLQMIAQPYFLGKFNFNNPEWYQKILLKGQEMKDLKEPRGNKDMMFVNRSFFGLYSILRQLDVEIDTFPAYAKTPKTPVLEPATV